MLFRSSLLLAVAVLAMAFPVWRAEAQDIDTCFAIADRLTNGEEVTAAEKEAGHKACQAALAATASIVQKSQIQEADFDIVGRPAPKPD